MVGWIVRDAGQPPSRQEVYFALGYEHEGFIDVIQAGMINHRDNDWSDRYASLYSEKDHVIRVGILPASNPRAPTSEEMKLIKKELKDPDWAGRYLFIARIFDVQDRKKKRK